MSTAEQTRRYYSSTRGRLTRERRRVLDRIKYYMRIDRPESVAKAKILLADLDARIDSMGYQHRSWTDEQIRDAVIEAHTTLVSRGEYPGTDRIMKHIGNQSSRVGIMYRQLIKAGVLARKQHLLHPEKGLGEKDHDAIKAEIAAIRAAKAKRGEWTAKDEAEARG